MNSEGSLAELALRIVVCLRLRLLYVFQLDQVEVYHVRVLLVAVRALDREMPIFMRR